MTSQHKPLVLLTGGTGTTGRRVADRLMARDIAVRCASRTGSPPFDWDRPDTWAALGRAPRDFTTFAAPAAAEGAWTNAIAQCAR